MSNTCFKVRWFLTEGTADGYKILHLGQTYLWFDTGIFWIQLSLLAWEYESLPYFGGKFWEPDI